MYEKDEILNKLIIIVIHQLISLLIILPSLSLFTIFDIVKHSFNYIII